MGYRDASDPLYFLVDCNQFFVSCEQLFNPKLRNKPVVVLSSNDGCIVSRSKEAKALGIAMGAPAFEYKALFREKNVLVCSSNFSLYADMSERVMRTLSQFSDEMQEYSVDEAFLKLPCKDPMTYGLQIRNSVLKWTGIPVSIGIARTKTLAKVACNLAKKQTGVLALLTDIDSALKHLPTQEIWGIGRRSAATLARNGITTALQLKNAADHFIQKQLSVFGLRTALELREIACLEKDPAPRKSITCSRSFAPISSFQTLNEILSTFLADSCATLREENLLASTLTIFFPHYGESLTTTLAEPSSYTPDFLFHAEKLLKDLYQEGRSYKKAGVILTDLISTSCYQRDFLVPYDERKKRLMQTLDHLNQNKKVLFFAKEGLSPSWKSKHNHRSPRYTTSWEEIFTIHL